MADVEKASAPFEAAGEGQAPPPPYAPQSYGATGVPPTYDQYQPVDSSAADAPPSYDSIFGRVRAAKAESTGVVDFFKKFVILLLSTIGCTIFVAIFLAIPVSMIAMGSVYIHSCAYEPYIPIYLIVGGCFGVVKNLSSMCQQIKNKRERREDDNAKTNPFDGTLNCFLFAWFIAGNVWIYRSYGRFNDSDPDSSYYCNPTLYAYAFWLTTASYIIALVSCCCFCVTGCICNMFPFSN